METSEFRTISIFQNHCLTGFSAGLRELCLKPGKTVMATLTMTILLSKWNSVWTYLRRRLTDSREPCFSSTMPLRTKSVRPMHPVLERCGRAPSSVGQPALADRKCETQFCQMDPFSPSITWRTIRPCQDGLKECRLSWKSEDYFGIKKMGRGLMGSAKTSNAPKERRTVAVAVFCSINQISLA